MTSKQRMILALDRLVPDRLPVTTHHVMPFFLENTLNRLSVQDFFDQFKLDPILWITALKPDPAENAWIDPDQGPLSALQAPVLVSDQWRVRQEILPDPAYRTVRYVMETPRKTLSMVLQGDDTTTWVTERPIKQKSDIEILADFAPVPVFDVDKINSQSDDFGQRGMVRGLVPGFDIYGQSGCWQDASVLYGIESLIYSAHDDPEWLHTFLNILCERKRKTVRSMTGARFDLVEHGGGDASSTVISPGLFDRFVAPYDAKIILEAHLAGQRIVYHTCGGMMPLLDLIADMEPDAMETFTPQAMGGDTDLGAAKKRIGNRVCLIGGFDQFHDLVGCTPDQTRQAVRRCFEQAGAGGGYILAPSDHFFQADLQCLYAFADEAAMCRYF